LSDGKEDGAAFPTVHDQSHSMLTRTALRVISEESRSIILCKQYEHVNLRDKSRWCVVMCRCQCQWKLVVRIGYAEIGIGQQRGIRLEWKEHMLNENQPGIGWKAKQKGDQVLYSVAFRSGASCAPCPCCACSLR
jgi:hypothetical protein